MSDQRDHRAKGDPGEPGQRGRRGPARTPGAAAHQQGDQPAEPDRHGGDVHGGDPDRQRRRGPATAWPDAGGGHHERAGDPDADRRDRRPARGATRRSANSRSARTTRTRSGRPSGWTPRWRAARGPGADRARCRPRTAPAAGTEQAADPDRGARGCASRRGRRRPARGPAEQQEGRDADAERDAGVAEPPGDGCAPVISRSAVGGRRTEASTGRRRRRRSRRRPDRVRVGGDDAVGDQVAVVGEVAAQRQGDGVVGSAGRRRCRRARPRRRGPGRSRRRARPAR